MSESENVLVTDFHTIGGGHEVPQVLARAQGYVRYANERLGANIGRGASVLDFGCGSGVAVYALLKLGYDAWGVDIDELWGSDISKANYETPPEAVQRLRVTEHKPYRIPFSDGHFDFVISEQTLEHVSDYVSVFREIIRVLKPGAISVHRFPGPLNLTESHINVPLPFLCYNRLWLSAWALLGRRAIWKGRQAEMTWQQVVHDNISMMSMNFYPSKAALRQYAAVAGGTAIFSESDEMLWRGGGRMKHFPFKPIASRILSPLMQRYMVLKRA